MRIPFIIAYATGRGSDIISSIPNITYFPPSDQWRMPRLCYSKNGNDYEFLIHKLKTVSIGPESRGTDGKWTVVLLTPLSIDWRVGPRAYRKFKRFINNATPGFLLGPRSIRHMAQQFPSFATSYLVDGDMNLIAPHIIAGDPAPQLIATVDYRPTSMQAFDDIEPDEDLLPQPEGD